MGAFERVFHKELAEAEARGRAKERAEALAEGHAEGRAEERQLIKECFVRAGMSPEEFDKCIASLKIK